MYVMKLILKRLSTVAREQPSESRMNVLISLKHVNPMWDIFRGIFRLNSRFEQP